MTSAENRYPLYEDDTTSLPTAKDSRIVPGTRRISQVDNASARTNSRDALSPHLYDCSKRQVGWGGTGMDDGIGSGGTAAVRLIRGMPLTEALDTADPCAWTAFDVGVRQILRYGHALLPDEDRTAVLRSGTAGEAASRTGTSARHPATGRSDRRCHVGGVLIGSGRVRACEGRAGAWLTLRWAGRWRR
ncbi:hypothetical protein GCM10027162_56000 [Streptomyces incanus]